VVSSIVNLQAIAANEGLAPLTNTVGLTAAGVAAVGVVAVIALRGPIAAWIANTIESIDPRMARYASRSADASPVDVLDDPDAAVEGSL